jgi:putative ABC transport system permease protein
MLSNYLTIALRNLRKNGFFTAINIVGLSIGLATGLLVLLWVADEHSFDRNHPQVEQLYREVSHFKTGEQEETWPGSPAPHAVYALREVPGVEMAVRVAKAGGPLVKSEGGQGQIEKKGGFAENNYFQMFSNTFLAGSAAQPFGDINTVVVTRKFGQRYFGANTDPADMIGKVLHFDKDPATVTAVIADYPENTEFQFDFLRPYAYIQAKFGGNGEWKVKDEDWGNFDCTTYFRLHPSTSPAIVGEAISRIQHTHNKYDVGSYYTLQKVADMHLYDLDGGDSGAQTARIMTFAAIFILLIACINYINLATAKATKRAREVGLRKAIGANRGQLIGQFLTESGLVFLVSSILALVFVYALMPYCNQIADKKMHLDWTNPQIPMLIGGVLVGAMLLSAIYPSLVLSAFSPLRMMRGQINQGKEGQATLRKTLVVVQFACSVALLLAMFVIGRQLNYIQTRNLGYDRSQVFQFAFSEETFNNRTSILAELRNSPGVAEVTTASEDILTMSSSTGDADWEGRTDGHNMVIAPMSVDTNYINFFKLQLKEGKGFTGTKADSTSFILNEAAIAQMGIKDPIGKRFKLWQTTGQIVGVVKDFHFASMRERIGPAVLMSKPDWLYGVSVKTTGEGTKAAIAAAGGIWSRFDKVYPFDYAFMDDTFDKMYKKDQRTARLFRAFGCIALFISCLGLFGLSAFTAEQRTKEIGVRKVLGASVASITGLLAKDFLKLVVIAIVIASPLAYYFMQEWLSNFAYRTNIEAWIFLAAGAVAVLIALATVSFQSVRAALVNPTKSLRSS